MYGTTPRKILGYQVLAAIAFSLLVLWLIPADRRLDHLRGRARGRGGCRWLVRSRWYYVELKRRQRMELIDKQMPDMIDLLVVTIEAGLGILASMRVASDSMSDPLGQELRLTLQEQRMGLSVDPGDREPRSARQTRRTCASSFARSPRASKLGVSIATTMRNLSRRDAQAASGDGGGEGAEDADQDALPAHLLHLPRALHRDSDADDHQHRRRSRLDQALEGGHATWQR